MKDLTTKVNALMDSHLTTFQTFINASTPDKEDTYSTSIKTEANVLHFAHIHVDDVGPPPIFQGHCYLFTVINRFTLWPEAIPKENTTSASFTSALLSGWIARFGIPEHITSDRGTTFTSELWASLMNLQGLTNHQTTAYDPASNDIIEHFYRNPQSSFFMSFYKDSNWFTQLPWVLLGPRTTLTDALNILAAEMVYGDLLVIPADFFFSSATSPDNLSAYVTF
ncbi:uncharacterized protein [Palaemon carinicauda]|uniref:uncharacterized protein n=1 Tax=Palaemon carinicauda TaxID=392227 RepID=UPI0035B5A693